jgi:hypothetical protein
MLGGLGFDGLVLLVLLLLLTVLLACLQLLPSCQPHKRP